MQLQTIKSADHITPQLFQSQYFPGKKPLVFRNFLANTTVLHKWNYDYLRTCAGELEVSLYGREDAFNEWVTSPPVTKMPLGEYLSLIEREPTDLRLFLFNLLQKKPALKQELSITDPTGGRILSWLPYLFFGGKGSSVRYHYDIDMSHVFLTQLYGEKRVLLFPLDQSVALYRLPYNFHGIANLAQPDYSAFPALALLKGWECHLRPGDTLYIPSGYWHYIQYLTDGYSVSYRALSERFTDRLTGLRNIFITRRFDNIMRGLFHRHWYQYKLDKAINKATRLMQQASSYTANTAR